jgi:hypothetical protein
VREYSIHILIILHECSIECQSEKSRKVRSLEFVHTFVIAVMPDVIRHPEGSKTMIPAYKLPE